jgi:hypothetical protein
MLVWALWLAASLVRAIGWGWRAFGEGGLWRKLLLRRRAPADETKPVDSPADGQDGSVGMTREESPSEEP